MNKYRCARSWAPNVHGLSVIELMVGIVVGLIVVTGIAKLFVDYVTTTKRQMLEARVNQDLRAAADLVARDLRRAGYWDRSLEGVHGIGVTTVTPNPHMTTLGAPSPAASSASTVAFNTVTYSYARNADNTLDSNEYSGFQLQAVNGVNVIRAQDGQGNWQSVTDPGTLRVTTFNVYSYSPTEIDLSSYCACLKTLTCTLTSIAANPAGAPKLLIHAYKIDIAAQAVAAPEIVRSVQEIVRVRNPAMTGACPA